MLGCKMLKHRFLISRHLVCFLTNSCFLCSTMYSLPARRFVKIVVFGFWNFNINSSYINIGRETLYWETRAFCVRVVQIIKTKRRSPGNTLTEETLWGGGVRVFYCDVLNLRRNSLSWLLSGIIQSSRRRSHLNITSDEILLLSLPAL